MLHTSGSISSEDLAHKRQGYGDASDSFVYRRSWNEVEVT